MMTSIGMQNDAVTSDDRGAAEPGPLYVHAKASSLAALEAECAGLRRQRDDLQAANTRLVEQCRRERADRIRAEQNADIYQMRAGKLSCDVDGVRSVLGATCGESVRQAAERVATERDIAARARDVNARTAQEARERADAAERLAHEAEAQREDLSRRLAMANIECNKLWQERDDARAKLARIAEAQRQIEDNAAPLDLSGCSIDHVYVPVCRVGAHALPLPAYAKPGDAGMDLRTPHDVHVQSYSRKRIPCGFAFAIPEGYEGQVRPKSGLSEKCIDVALGTIDSGYRGEVEALVVNNGTGTMTFKAGDKIAQIVFCPVARATLREVDALDETERGASGFGSSGVR